MVRLLAKPTGEPQLAKPTSKPQFAKPVVEPQLAKPTGKPSSPNQLTITPYHFTVPLVNPLLAKYKLPGPILGYYISHKRPYITYFLSIVSYFMYNPKRNMGLMLEAFSYVDYAISLVDRGSTSSYCTFHGGNLVNWRSKK
ncbi:Copia protein [Gossypium australe]|uniref:Copia protein n=1 Tax=Gossypium australe TaxID=47621 RepID=A0A5B6WPD3_9ROSI|nr:Copia protein [Gossypium australe]